MLNQKTGIQSPKLDSQGWSPDSSNIFYWILGAIVLVFVALLVIDAFRQWRRQRLIDKRIADAREKHQREIDASTFAGQPQ